MFPVLRAPRSTTGETRETNSSQRDRLLNGTYSNHIWSDNERYLGT
ncbi:hypothetical protein BIFPSEUDO_03545 [Bifidobacterium pseudocatenulatum DSM 20438 = JCM 1200 = LMG 10505]|uniref:Uncharacterized protein n=1 Tax=Bifidobacterium pseudocatenulatum DSM 20438 = JCM 1200 = LMG 10505 TaxID=547043 RepID=C0BT26_BIFPS|nr:hypothetical protein BIFPSEUDO_03545 [Bifidobacterium pseudocatenulatum DSM 20438 = JCM 1200 = LMG 10505]